MIKVWTDAAEAGLLDRHGERGSTFAYQPGAPPARAVSVTMPVRLESWSAPFGLLPIFEMNLPEGVLRERLRLAFAKATGTFDEFDLLSIVGRSQVGRIRYTGDKEQLNEDVPFQSVDEILERSRGGDLFRYLLEKFASFSGISGVQPKILVRDEKAFAEMEHTVADVLELLVVFDVGVKFRGSVLSRGGNAFEYLSDTGRSGSHARLTQALQFLCARPFCRTVESKRHAVLGQIDGGGHKIIDGRETGFALHVFIDNPEILQMRVAVAQRAVEGN